MTRFKPANRIKLKDVQKILEHELRSKTVNYRQSQEKINTGLVKSEALMAISNNTIETTVSVVDIARSLNTKIGKEQLLAGTMDSVTTAVSLASFSNLGLLYNL